MRLIVDQEIKCHIENSIEMDTLRVRHDKQIYIINYNDSLRKRSMQIICE